MAKLSYIFNSLSFLIILFCSWKLFSIHTEGEFLKQEITDIKLKISELEVAREEAQKGQVDKLAREKRKNLELSQKADASSDEINDLTRKRDEMKVVIEENQKKVDSLSSEIQDNKVKLAGVAKEIETSQNELKRITNSVPIMENSIEPIRNQIAEEKRRKKEMENEMLTYGSETEFLNNHFDLTRSFLQKDFYEHPWLERGEKVSVSFSSVDLTSGLLMLPIGKDHGMEAKMRFSVRNKGRIICQIKIKEVAYDHCIALILPLMGNPFELMEIKELDLVHL